jgi:kynurenine formamidase
LAVISVINTEVEDIKNLVSFKKGDSPMPQRIIDLTLPLFDGMRGVKLEPYTTIATVGYNTTTAQLYSHAGTHMDAPRHFLEGGGTIDRVPLERCIGPALVVDLSHKGPHSLITVEELAPYVAQITPGSRVLLRTDWDRYANQAEYRQDMPRVSAELARWLVERKINLLGVQTPSVASVRPEDKAELIEVHQILLKAEIIIVEGLANLSQLNQAVVTFIALPLKIAGCDGSPVRALALEKEGF